MFIFSGAASAASIPLQQGDSIQDAIDGANASDTIDLSAGTYNQYDITVTKSITIEGPTVPDKSTPTAVIDAQNKGRVFHIASGATVTLRNLVIENGDTSSEDDPDGGGIYNEGTLNLQSDTIQDNNAIQGNGGGIDNEGVVTVDNTNFGYNKATYNSGGGGIFNDGSFTMTGSEVSNNLAIFSNGGGILNEFYCTMTITGSSINNNIGSYQGGGIENYGTMTLSASNLYSNTAYLGSGGIDNLGDLTVKTNSHITYNVGIGCNGGGIGNYGTMTVTSSDISNNNAILGGGIYNSGSGVNIENSNINSNTATTETGSGGGIYNTGSDFNIDNSNINSNTATESGGGVENFGNLIITDSTINYNIVTDNIRGNGGGLDNSGTLDLLGSNICYNTAAFGGGICNEINGILFVNNSSINSNIVSCNGGGVCNWLGTTTLNDSNITSNIALSGGAIYSNAGSTVINFCRIVGNNVCQSLDIISDNDSVTLNAENNWWGSNSNPTGRVSGNVDISTWLVLNTNASPTRVTPGGVSIITADLTHDQNGTYHNPILWSGTRWNPWRKQLRSSIRRTLTTGTGNNSTTQ